jgi:hypothetical protein
MNARFTLATVLGLCLLFGSSCRGKSSKKEASLDDLNHALVMWMVTKPAPPGDISELTNSVAMRGKRLPTAPPGKKLAVDPVQGKVVWVDQ